MTLSLATFDAAARARVNDAVADAEKKTAAEILPVVATCSGSYDRAEDIVGLWTGIALAGVAWLLFQGVTEGTGWDGENRIQLGFWWLVLILVVGFVGGVILANRISWLRRLFTPTREMDGDTITRAKTIFFDRRLHRTSRGSGVLLYVSLLERRVVVLVDDAIAEKFSERTLQELRDEILTGVREGDLAKSLVLGLERLGSLLQGPLPSRDGQVDEVPSEVVVLT